MADHEILKKVTIISAKEDHEQVEKLEEHFRELGCTTRSYPGHDYESGGDERTLGLNIAESLESADLIIALRSENSDQSRWLRAELEHIARHNPDKLFETNATEMETQGPPQRLLERVKAIVPRMPPDWLLTSKLRGSWSDVYTKGRRARERGAATATEGLDQMESLGNTEERARVRTLRQQHGDHRAMEIIDDAVRQVPSVEPVRPSLTSADQALVVAVAQDDWAYGRFEKGRRERQKQSPYSSYTASWIDEDDVDYRADHVEQALTAFEKEGSGRQAARIRELRRQHGDRKALAMIESAIEVARARYINQRKR